MNMKKMFTMQHIPEIAPALMFKKKKIINQVNQYGFPLHLCCVYEVFSEYEK